MPDGTVNSMDIVWKACLCHVWPLSIWGGVARCGRCGTRPTLVVEAPREGKAMSLFDYIRTSQRKR